MTTVDLAMKKNSKESFRIWLVNLPQDSLERLRIINMSTGSSRHIILSLTFGIYDAHIRKLTRMITSLLLARLAAERTGKFRLVARIDSFMDELHAAVDYATGCVSQKHSQGPSCNRAVPVKAILPR